MIKAKFYKELNGKDYIKIFSPIIAGIFLVVLLEKPIQSFVNNILGESLNYQPEVIGIEIELPEKPKTDIKILASFIDVKPYSIIEKNVKSIKEPAPLYRISFIYIGKNRYVVINNKLFKERDILPSGERILKITRDKILVTGKWGERWIKFLEY